MYYLCVSVILNMTAQYQFNISQRAAGKCKQHVRKNVMRKLGIKSIHRIISSLVVKNNIIIHKTTWKGMFVSPFTNKGIFKHLFELPICNNKSSSMKNKYRLDNVSEVTDIF